MVIDILIRFGGALLIILAGLLLYWGLNQILLHKAQKNMTHMPFSMSGKPVILYFTTPDCIPCKTVQRPAIEKIRQMKGDRVEIIEIDSSEKINIAREWNVFSVPTTFIIDSEGKTRYANYGIARAEKLLKQINRLETDF